MKIISIYNRKGGVGKSTCAASVGGFLSRAGHKVLLVDLDSQANLTSTFLGTSPRHSTSEIYTSGLIPIISVSLYLDISPASDSLAGIDYTLGGRKDRYDVLKETLADKSATYDYILLDLPPAMNHIVIGAIKASHYLLSPILPDIDSLHGLKMVEEVCMYARKNDGINGIYLNAYNPRRTVDRQVAEAVREHYGETVYEAAIRQCSKLRECRIYHTDIATYAPHSSGGQDYLQLTNELITRIL